MIRTIQLVFSLLTRQERIKLIWVFFAVIIMGILEVVSISSVMPFMAVASSPDIIYSNIYLKQLFVFSNLQTEQHFLIFLGLIVFIALIIGNGFTAFTIWLLLRFSHMQEHILAERLLKKYLYKSYVYFITRNTGELSKNLINEVNRVVVGILMPGMLALAKMVAAIFIVGLLLLVDTRLAGIVTLVLGSVYIGFYYLIRKKLFYTGHEATNASRLRFIAVKEAFGGIKELKLLGREDDFIRRFSVPSYCYARYSTINKIFSQLPKYAFETIAFAGILLIVLYYLVVKGDMEYIMPIITLYAFSGYRLMNALHVIFAGLTDCRYYSPALEILHKDFTDYDGINDLSVNELNCDFIVKGMISLRDLDYRYPNMQKSNLQDISLNIPVNTTVGIIGETGSGKTTLVDIMLGLLVPSKGEISIGGVILNRDNIRCWQKNLGYVPQSIYLTDDTIMQNIAFGVPIDSVDTESVEKAAKIANIHDFIINELPEGYATRIGEKGIKLSGGQIQRIGIARALYHKPQVLVLDEATSALDGATENIVMEAIRKLTNKMTIIIVAHRMTTIKECNEIFMLDHGRLVANGNYREMEKKILRFTEVSGSVTVE